MTQSDSAAARQQCMLRWLATQIPGHSDARSASSDASFRQYYRVFHAQRSYIVMDAPPEHEDCAPFVDVCERLANQGLRVPVVRASELTQGFLLLDDLGSETALAALDSGVAAEEIYPAAIQALLKMQPAETKNLPLYDEAMLRREMALFPDWFLKLKQKHEISAAESQAWESAQAFLVDEILRQPRGFVHRDYHSRNLMWTKDQPLGVLDFQDAVSGPLTYDLVSLLRDCYVAWPIEQLEAWREQYRVAAIEQGLLPVEYSAAQFKRAFDLMGVQRHLKAAGIFCRLSYRDGKDGYLADIPRTLGYIAQVAAEYPELAQLTAWVDQYPR